MGRLILIAVAVLVVVWLVRRALASGSSAREKVDKASEAKGDLVSCAHCKVNLPRAEARTAGGRHYCSEEHWRLGPKDD
jgi:uncharacterized protein